MADFDLLQIRKLDGGLLLVFRELLARRQASAVARQLGLSASSISHALSRLREVYGDPLFVRRSHGLEPTPRALQLEDQIAKAIEILGESIGGEMVFNSTKTRRRFKIACAEPFDSVIGPALVEVFRSEAPFATYSTR
jgi:DNA-binding transcriptional LysR family regulator